MCACVCVHDIYVGHYCEGHALGKVLIPLGVGGLLGDGRPQHLAAQGYHTVGIRELASCNITTITITPVSRSGNGCAYSRRKCSVHSSSTGIKFLPWCTKTLSRLPGSARDLDCLMD
jgi:hypothetical protein